MPAQPTWTASIAKYIPGFGTYLSLQTRRDDDLEVRRYLASRLQECKRDLQVILSPLVDAGKFDVITQGERLRSAIENAQSKIRAAVEGYSSWFESKQVDEAKLKQVVDLDNDLVGVVDRLQNAIGKLASSAFDFKEANEAIGLFRERFARRDEILKAN